MAELASIVGTTQLPFTEHDWSAHECDCLREFTNWLGLLSGKDSAGLALFGRQMCLGISTGEDAHFQPIEYSPEAGPEGSLTLDDLQSLSKALASDTAPEHYMTEHRTMPYRALVVSEKLDRLANMLDIPDLGASRGVLIKKPWD